MDLALSRAITMIHILEKAVHDQRAWSMELCGIIVSVQRCVDDTRVVFRAEFPGMDAAEGIFLVTLRCAGEVVLVREVALTDRTGDEPFMIEWALSVPEEVVA